jgi:GntR family transcriptional regulator, transcriptional repressor for pyruvate dehydrogenase complex
MFTKVSPSRLHEDVADQIEQAIMEGTFGPGDKLPSERELQEKIGASRGTLREAFRVLEQKGLIEIKTGVSGGCFVKAITSDKVRESIALLIRLKKISLEQLADFREGVEGLAALKATKLAQKEDILELKGLLSEAKEHVKMGASNWYQYNQLETMMHKKLVSITGNPLWEAVIIMVHENIPVFAEYLIVTDNTLRQGYQDWCEIVEALENGRAEVVASLIQSHIQRFYKYLKEGKEKREKSGRKRI